MCGLWSAEMTAARPWSSSKASETQAVSMKVRHLKSSAELFE
jgi:hypothetical protein